MKLKKIAILMLALLLALSSSALAKVTIETSLDKLAEANGSEAVEGQNGAVDGIIHFDYNGKAYTYYHINDGANGYFLPVVYMEEALNAAYDLSTPSDSVTGYWAALEDAMNAFLNRNSTEENDSVDTDTSGFFTDASDDADETGSYAPVSGNSGSYSTTGSSSSKKTATPELGDESLPLPALLALAALTMAGALYARKRSHEA